MTATPTPIWSLPLYDGSEDAGLQTIANTLSNALESALTLAANKFGFAIYATQSALNAAPGTALWQHAVVNADPTAANNGEYTWNGTAWVKQFLLTGHAELEYVPPTTAATPSSGSANWLGLGSVTIPQGTTTARVTYNFENMTTPSSSCNVTMQLQLGGGTATGRRIPGSATNSTSFAFGATQDITGIGSTGSQQLVIQATFVGGAGAFSVGTGSLVTAEIDFYA